MNFRNAASRGRIGSLLLIAILCFTSAAIGQEAPKSSPKPRRMQMRLPPWAKSAWFFRRQAEQPWALTGGNVVDVNTGNVLKSANIVIAGDVIQSVSADPLPDGIETVDISGRYVIPGLFDLHAHVMPRSPFYPDAPSAEEAFELLIDNGVTTIRLLPIVSELAHGWAARINAGELLGPTVVPASQIFEKSPQRTSMGFDDADTAEAWARKEALLGARWIKVYNKMDAASLRRIVAVARQYGMKVCGHAQDVPPAEAIEIGQATIEHITGIPLSCQADGATPPAGLDLGARTGWLWKHVDDARSADLMDTFIAHDAGWVPTLVVSEQIVKTGSHDGRETKGAAAIADHAAALKKAATLAVGLHRRGGRVGLGTDFPVDGVMPGPSAHREMELFVEQGGAMPLEALQIATIGSAKILGFDGLLGSIEPGKLANLVVVEENPLEDISRSREILLVVHEGRRHEPATNKD